MITSPQVTFSNNMTAALWVESLVKDIEECHDEMRYVISEMQSLFDADKGARAGYIAAAKEKANKDINQIEAEEKRMGVLTQLTKWIANVRDVIFHKILKIIITRHALYYSHIHMYIYIYIYETQTGLKCQICIPKAVVGKKAKVVAVAYTHSKLMWYKTRRP